MGTKREVPALAVLERSRGLVQTEQVRKHATLYSGLLCLASITSSLTASAQTVDSAELYTGASYTYGRFEARVRFAAGPGVIGSFFLWKDGSELAENFWNELDFEKVGADCHLESNALFGKPAATHVQKHTLEVDVCADFHVYAYEWTPEYIAWLVDGVEVRRETDATATAFAENAPEGMQIRFNIWPGDPSFGGNLDPSILPVQQQVDWVQYSSWSDGTFTLDWREEFDGSALSDRWLTANWASPKNKSTHSPANVTLADSMAVLSLTETPVASGGTGGSPTGSAGTGGSAPSGAGAAGSPSAAGSSSAAGSPSGAGGSTSSNAGGTGGSVQYNGYDPNAGCSIEGAGSSRGALWPLGAALLLGGLARRRARGHRLES